MLTDARLATMQVTLHIAAAALAGLAVLGTAAPIDTAGDIQARAGEFLPLHSPDSLAARPVRSCDVAGDLIFQLPEAQAH